MKKRSIFIIVWTVVLCAAMLLSACGQAATEAETDTAIESAEPVEAESQEAEAAENEEENAEVSAEETAAASYVIDYDALFKSIDPEEVVMTVDGKEVSWNEYFYWIRYYAEYIQYYIDMYKYYGMDYKWTDPADEEGTMTLADSVRIDAGNHMGMICSIENYAEENGIRLSADTLKTIEEDLQAQIAEYCGEDATEEDFDELLRESDYLTLDIYKRYSIANYLYQEIFKQTFGANGEKVSDEAALKYLEDNGYMRANHILFMTIDPSTGEALDDDTVAEKTALAEKTAAELQRITDKDRLLRKFTQMKNEYDEDTGKYQYPDGYVFTSGKMVQEFEDGYNALEDYEISDPILSQYGYHIMIRLPNDPDAVVEYSDEGTALNARMEYANSAYSDMMQEKMDSAQITLSDSIVGLSVADFLVEAPEESSEAEGE